MSTKVHFIYNVPEGAERVWTGCGMEGFREDGTATEYTTRLGQRFGATRELVSDKDNLRVTCGRCLRSRAYAERL